MPDAGKLAPGIPKSNFWASDPNGINQVGCVYTAQGFEFDYVGVIFGRDLVYDVGWRGNRKISQDGVVKKAAEEEFVNLVLSGHIGSYSQEECKAAPGSRNSN